MMRSQLKQSIALRWGAVIAWMALIFALSAQSKLPELIPGLPALEEIGGHLSEYAILALLLWWALRGTGTRYPATWSLVSAALYGITDEVHQSFVPGRTMSVSDLLVDLIGAALALSIAGLITARRLAHRSAGQGL